MPARALASFERARWSGPETRPVSNSKSRVDVVIGAGVASKRYTNWVLNAGGSDPRLSPATLEDGRVSSADNGASARHPGGRCSQDMAARLIRLRYAATCSGCAASLAPATSAWWDGDHRTARCATCGAAARPDACRSPAIGVDPVPQPTGRPAVAGGSAQREFERRKAKRHDAIRSRHPRIGALLLAVTEEPSTTTNWAKGAEGERKLGAGLDNLAERGVLMLHDRRRPGTTANIDHLAVAPTGVWVIDAKRYTGQVAKKDVGGWFSSDVRLFIGRRDCTKLVTGMAKQVDAVRTALGAEWADVPVRPVLCFVETDWRWFASPFELDGVLVTWPKALRELLVRSGPYVAKTVERINGRLDERLRPAT
jgi:hypothetical protein